MVKFCGCHGPIDRVDQLLRACLFPSTAKLPRQAFELSTLRLVDLVHLEAAASMDALAAVLQRLTNNTYPWGESVCCIVAPSSALTDIFLRIPSNSFGGFVESLLS
jgi:hypothetical protein